MQASPSHSRVVGANEKLAVIIDDRDKASVKPPTSSQHVATQTIILSEIDNGVELKSQHFESHGMAIRVESLADSGPEPFLGSVLNIQSETITEDAFENTERRSCVNFRVDIYALVPTSERYRYGYSLFFRVVIVGGLELQSDWQTHQPPNRGTSKESRCTNSGR